MASALMVIAPEKFRDEELFVPKEYLEKHGVTVEVASTKKGTCVGVLGGKIESQHTLSEVDVSKYDAVIFVGGPGTPVIRKESSAIKIAQDAFAKGKLVCAICWAPTTLAKAGVLKGKKSTVWMGPDREFGMSTSDYIESQGAQYVAKGAVEDGNIVTADGPGSALDFAKLIMKKLEK